MAWVALFRLRSVVSGATELHRTESEVSRLVARNTPAAERSAEQAALVHRAGTVIAELLAADRLVIGAPMYNPSIPGQLKAWIDLVSVAGVTFCYGPDGAEGLLKGKRAVIVATAGGQHAGRPSGRAHADCLQLLLSFLGVADVLVISAEGLAMGPAVREPALAWARALVVEVAAARGRAAPAAAGSCRSRRASCGWCSAASGRRAGTAA